jgi:hypothetical protein
MPLAFFTATRENQKEAQPEWPLHCNGNSFYIFLFWEYLFQIFGILSLQCGESIWGSRSKKGSLLKTN